MSNTQISPGPWRVEVDTSGNFEIACPLEDGRVAEICSIKTTGYAQAISHDEAEANANAMAALPELIAVCFCAMSAPGAQSLRDQARRAFEKAGTPGLKPAPLDEPKTPPQKPPAPDFVPGRGASFEQRAVILRGTAMRLFSAIKSASHSCMEATRLATALATMTDQCSDIRREALAVVSFMASATRELDVLPTGAIHDVTQSDDACDAALPGDDEESGDG